MDVLIRPLGGEDAAAYRALRLRALREHPEAFATCYAEEQERSFEEVQARLIASPQQVTHGAWDADQLLGFATLIRPTKTKLRHRATLAAMYVVPAARGRGLASALLTAALESARAWGVADVALAVTVENDRARSLYTQAGFHSYGVEPRSLFVAGVFYDVEWLNLRLRLRGVSHASGNHGGRGMQQGQNGSSGGYVPAPRAYIIWQRPRAARRPRGGKA